MAESSDIEEIGRKVIVKNFVALKKYMHPDPIIDCETDFELLTVTDKQSFQVKNLIEKNDAIFRKVISKGARGYKDFKERLRKTCQTELLELIICAENGQDANKIEDRLKKIASLSPEYIKYRGELKRDLMRFYKWSHSNVPLSPLFNEKDTPLASFYIRPELTVKNLQDMFETEGVANREIYLKADAGLGKTTFSKYLATSWYQAHCPDETDVKYFENNDIDCMRDFDFVFLVLLRDSNTSCSVDELIFKLIVSYLVNSKSYTEEFMQELFSREKCLVILDGLDEWTHPNKQCERAPRSIPHRNVRENCTILTTTRPWKLGDLNLSSNELGKTVELTKLSYNSVYTLVKRTFRRLKSPPHNISIEIEDYTFVGEIFKSRVAHLAYVPLLLMYMICLRCEGFKIGNSKCDLYVKIVELLLLRTTLKYGDIPQTLSSSNVPACCADHDKCKEYFPLLVNLGQLAYHTLSNKTRENTLVFDGSVTEKYLTPEEMKFTLHSGILSQSTTTKLTKKVSKVSFSHKTVQEFFAAIFLSSENDDRTIVLEKIRTVGDILDMSKIWEYLNAMNAGRMCEISYDLMSVINEDEETRDYRTKTGHQATRTDPEDMYPRSLYNIQIMYMSCLQEKPEDEKIQLCVQDFFIDKDTVDSKQFQRLLKQNKSNIKSLYIDMHVSSIYLCEIIDVFSLTDLSHIEKLYYDGKTEKEAEIGRVLFPSLKNVTLLEGEWTNDEEIPGENLARVQNLQYLYIYNFKLSHKTLEIFFNFISGQKSLKELTLNGLYCKEHGGRDCKRLNLDLSQHSTLSKLHLVTLPWRLQLNISTPPLVNVKLSKINLDKSLLLLSRDLLNIERKVLWEIEKSARSLQNVTLLEGEWTNDEENPGENLARVQNLQYLYIYNFKLSHKTLETFFNFISGQKSMKELTLNGLYCKEHCGYDCKRLNLDLSQHSTLSKLHLVTLPWRLQLNISTPSLVNVKLSEINLDKSSLLLSRDLLNIERVVLWEIEMSAGSLHNFILLLENLPQSVIVKMFEIKPETEYERVRENIRSSQTFHVMQKQNGRLDFQTIKPSKE